MDGKNQVSSLEIMDRKSEKVEVDNDVKDARIAELTRANGILKANISTLYRTAKAEIARKNARISELQSELDDLIFKRMNRVTDQSQINQK